MFAQKLLMCWKLVDKFPFFPLFHFLSLLFSFFHFVKAGHLSRLVATLLPGNGGQCALRWQFTRRERRYKSYRSICLASKTNSQQQQADLAQHPNLVRVQEAFRLVRDRALELPVRRPRVDLVFLHPHNNHVRLTLQRSFYWKYLHLLQTLLLQTALWVA